MRRLLTRYPKSLAALLLGAVMAGGFVLYRSYFPYGRSHCCIKLVSSTLEQYADDHDGRYPAGQASPEASLSLLHRNPYDLNADVLRGKSVPEGVVRDILDRGELLGPDTCGWHYVEGLTQNDDRRLALLWDKVGLGHFGERHWGGSREVVLVGGDMRVVSAEEWPHFLQEQQELLGKRDALAVRGGPVLTATIRWPGGEVSDHCDGPYCIEEKVVFPGGSGSGTAREGDMLQASDLQWKGSRLVPLQATKTWVLVLPKKGMRSRPMTVRLDNGRATPASIVFEMQKEK